MNPDSGPDLRAVARAISGVLAMTRPTRSSLDRRTRRMLVSVWTCAQRGDDLRALDFPQMLDEGALT